MASGELVSNGEIAQVFDAAGWRVAFERDSRPADPPNADIARLRGLGVTPRGVKDVVRGYLEGLKA